MNSIYTNSFHLFGTKLTQWILPSERTQTHIYKQQNKWFIWSNLHSARLTSAKESPDDAMLKFPACWLSIKLGAWRSLGGVVVRGRICKSWSSDQIIIIMGCTCSGCFKWGALVVALVVLFVSGVQLWLREKSYVFCARELADITTDVLRTTKGDPNCVRIL